MKIYYADTMKIKFDGKQESKDFLKKPLMPIRCQSNRLGGPPNCPLHEKLKIQSTLKSCYGGVVATEDKQHAYDRYFETRTFVKLVSNDTCANCKLAKLRKPGICQLTSLGPDKFVISFKCMALYTFRKVICSSHETNIFK